MQFVDVPSGPQTADLAQPLFIAPYSRVLRGRRLLWCPLLHWLRFPDVLFLAVHMRPI